MTGYVSRVAAAKKAAMYLSLGFLAACASHQKQGGGVAGGNFSNDDDYGMYKVGKPYRVADRMYYPGVENDYDRVGLASWYGPEFNGRRTANGDVFDMHAMTAAHQTLPMPSLVRVTNLANNKSAVVMVNDRGPFAENRIIDLSSAAADAIGSKTAGVARVRVQYLKGQTEDFLSRMEGGVPTREYQPLRLARSYDVKDSADAPAGFASETRSPALRDPYDVSGYSNEARSYRDEDLPPYTDGEPAYEPSSVYPSGGAAVSQRDIPAPDRPSYSQAVSEAGGPVKAKGYYVQAGSFSVADNALRVQRKLETLGEVKNVRSDSGAMTVYRVMLGPVDSRSRAEDRLDEVIRMGYYDAKIISPGDRIR